MSSKNETLKELAKKIEATDEKIHVLDGELESIGKLASSELKHRLDAIKVEEHALQRNFAELGNSSPPDAERVRKVESLLHHIEEEEEELEHEAEFLKRGNLTTLEFAFRSLTRFFDRGPFPRNRN